MEKYQFFTVQDFLQDENFRNWILEEARADPAMFWEEVLAHFPEQESVVAAAKALLLTLHESQSFPTADQGAQMWQKIEVQAENQPNLEDWQAKAPTTRPPWKWLAAATVLLALGLGWATFWQNSDRPATYAVQVSESALPLLEKTNESGKPQDIRLSDGSLVKLYPGSRISFENPFSGNKRAVFFSGKGYFEVVKDDSKPFVVFANNLVTQVVGTSFTVEAYDQKPSARVVVKSGKVKVFTLEKFRAAAEGKGEEMVLLTANQQANYNFAKNDFVTGYVAAPALIRTPEAHPDFNFQNAAVADVFKTLEEAYGVKIEYDRTILKECNLTAPLGDEPLFRKLDIVCQTIGARYEVWETRIVVTGRGCTP